MNKMNLPTPFGPITARPPMVRKLLEFSRFKNAPAGEGLLRLNAMDALGLSCALKLRSRFRVTVMEIRVMWRMQSC